MQVRTQASLHQRPLINLIGSRTIRILQTGLPAASKSSGKMMNALNIVQLYSISALPNAPPPYSAAELPVSEQLKHQPSAVPPPWARLPWIVQFHSAPECAPPPYSGHCLTASGGDRNGQDNSSTANR